MTAHYRGTRWRRARIDDRSGGTRPGDWGPEEDSSLHAACSRWRPGHRTRMCRRWAKQFEILKKVPQRRLCGMRRPRDAGVPIRVQTAMTLLQKAALGFPADPVDSRPACTHRAPEVPLGMECRWGTRLLGARTVGAVPFVGAATGIWPGQSTKGRGPVGAQAFSEAFFRRDVRPGCAYAYA